MTAHKSEIITLNNDLFSIAVNFLINKDYLLAGIIERYGMPDTRYRKPCFATLLYIILEQQVSLASAAAVYNKLLKDSGKITPECILSYSDNELKAFGFSRQKTGYARQLAKSVLSKNLKLNSLSKMNDAEVRTILTRQKGVGKWTSDIYLLFALKRPDIWPRYDLALISTIKELKKLRKTPDEYKLDRIAEHWKPWRSVAARILWHHYLSK